MNLFDLTLKLNGFPLQKAKLTLEAIHNKSELDFQTYIHQQKKAILQYHLQYNTFYKNFTKNADVNAWDSIPVMTKRNLQQPLNKRLSDGFTTKNVYVNKTSGSTGDPFIFAKDKFCHALTWAVIQNRFGWYGLDFNNSKQARFYGIPLDKKGYYKERFKDILSNRFRFSVFDLSDTALQKVLLTFSKKKFDYLNGYTTSIVAFAKFLKRQNVVLKQVCPSLSVCVVTSEMLFSSDKTLLETQLGVPVVNEYGASELDIIAFQNHNSQWRVNSETLFVEILDKNNQVLPYGEEGRVVITSLYNKAHPFIRYEIGDIGVLDENSTATKPILKQLIGRSDDEVLLPSGKTCLGWTFSYITKNLIEEDGSVKEFLIKQIRTDTFIIEYVSDRKLSAKQEKQIKEQIELYLEPGLILIFTQKDVLQRSKTGKLKQFSSLIQKN